MEIQIRSYRPSDCRETAALFYSTVRTVNRKDYSEEQVRAWAPEKMDLENWRESFTEHFALVAVAGEQNVGFGDIAQDGYLDRLFVHRNYQRRGIGTAICDLLEQMAGTDTLCTHASITARNFFEKRGYLVLREQQAERRGVLLANFVMEKRR